MIFGRMSQLPPPAAVIQDLVAFDRVEDQSWQPYQDTAVAGPQNAQRSPAMLFHEQLCRLSDLSGEMVNTFHASRERFTPRGLSATYAQYQEWYRSLPDVFRLENTSLPHVLLLHMYYHASILQ